MLSAVSQANSMAEAQGLLFNVTVAATVAVCYGLVGTVA